jgi:hypothetical protein
MRNMMFIPHGLPTMALIMDRLQASRHGASGTMVDR